MNPDSRKQIAIVYFDAASGHRSAAAALKRVLDEDYPAWQTDTINIVDVFDHHKRLGPVARYGIDRFNRQLKKDRVFDLNGHINLGLLSHDLLKERGIRQLARYWADAPPDAVVSVTPMYNPALFQSVRMVNPKAICITIPVDFEQPKARYWFTPKTEQHYLNGTERLWQQARQLGIPDSHNHRLSGMIADPACYLPAPPNRAEMLRQLGLDPALPTGLMSFGGQGCTLLLDTAKVVAGSKLAVNMLFLCGRSDNVRRAIEQIPAPYPRLALGYLPDTPVPYLHLADFAIGKPGTMTITEALITQTPLIAIKSRGMRLVQRGNEEWLVEKGVGILADGVREVVPAIRQILSSDDYRQRTAEHLHRAIYEAAAILGRLVGRASSVPGPLTTP